MYIDRIDLSIPQEDLQSVMEAFASAAASLELLPSVSLSDRKRYAKLGLKNEALALQIIEVGRKNRHLIPAGLDFEKIDRDLVAREQLRTLKVILQGLLDRVSDSMLLTGVDLYAAALSMYHCLRRNADTASLKMTVNELKKGFARPSRKKKEQEAAAAPVPVTIQAAVGQDAGQSATPGEARDVASPQRVHADKSSDRYEPVAHVPRMKPVVPVALPERLGVVPFFTTDPQTSGVATSFHVSCFGVPVFLAGGFTSAASKRDIRGT